MKVKLSDVPIGSYFYYPLSEQTAHLKYIRTNNIFAGLIEVFRLWPDHAQRLMMFANTPVILCTQAENQ